MSIHSSGRNGSFSPPIIAHDVPRGLPEQGNSPGTVTASASFLLPPFSAPRVPGLGLWGSCPPGFPLIQPPMGPYTLRMASRSLLNPWHCSGLGSGRFQSQLKSWWKCSHGAHPSNRNGSRCFTVEADVLPAAPRFFTRSNFLHTAHTPAETCPCSALHASPMPSPPPPPAVWQGHIFPFLAGTLLFFHMWH